jgi:hypothetical protein
MYRWLVIPLAGALAFAAACSDDAEPTAKPGPGPKPEVSGDAGKQVTPPPPTPDKPGKVENLPAQIVSMAVDKPVLEVGGAATVTVAAVDPDKDAFLVFWSASCGAISPDPGKSTEAIFLAPLAPGVCKVTAEVQDTELVSSITRSVDIVVEAASEEEVDDVR